MATFTKFTDNHGVARKGDKLDIVALSFENNTTAIFDECLSDQGFKDLFIANFFPFTSVPSPSFAL